MQNKRRMRRRTKGTEILTEMSALNTRVVRESRDAMIISTMGQKLPASNALTVKKEDKSSYGYHEKGEG